MRVLVLLFDSHVTRAMVFRYRGRNILIERDLKYLSAPFLGPLSCEFGRKEVKRYDFDVDNHVRLVFHFAAGSFHLLPIQRFRFRMSRRESFTKGIEVCWNMG
jgi:hypothetical protein